MSSIVPSESTSSLPAVSKLLLDIVTPTVTSANEAIGENNNEDKVLMIQRKDSLSYIEFLRGKYKSIYDTDYIKLLFLKFFINWKCNHKACKSTVVKQGFPSEILSVGVKGFEPSTPCSQR